jgi:hypothetical protein
LLANHWQNVRRKNGSNRFPEGLGPLSRFQAGESPPQIGVRPDHSGLGRLHTRERLDVGGELLQRLVLGHRSGPEHLFFLPPQAFAVSVRYPEMKESNPDFAIPSLDPFHPTFRNLGPWTAASQFLDVEVATGRGASRLVRSLSWQRSGAAFGHDRTIHAFKIWSKREVGG